MGALHGLAGWGMHAPQPTDGTPVPSAAPHAVQTGNLAGAAKQAKGSVSHVAPALAAAARGESVAEQAQRVTGPVKMSAAAALRVAGAMAPDPGGAPRQAMQTANGDPTTGYHSPFVGIGLSGITDDQQGAEDISTGINGQQRQAHGYSVYGANPNTYAQGGQPGVQSPDAKNSSLDTLTDTAAVTQYAAAADLGITLTPNSRGDGRQVQIDWAALSKMNVQADLSVLGQKVKYDNPAQVANNGEQAVFADMVARGAKPEDKNQFISLTGHSGGGQPSFYTALKLASDGYKNVSVVGVDMAMTPHQREVLEALGVNVTNITSNSTTPVGGQVNSPVGEAIRVGMGGGQNYYDLNVNRQNDTLNPSKMHGIINDANVVTTVRFAQYLDSTGQHGQYSPEMYAQFLRDTNGTGNQVSIGKDERNQPNAPVAADANLFAPGSGQVRDQRQSPGPEANGTQAGSGGFIENAISLLNGKQVTQAIKGVGQTIHNGFDAAGNLAQSAFGLIPKAGSFLGGLFGKGADLLGSGVNGVGNLVGNGLNMAGNVAQSTMSTVAGASNFLGSAAGNGLHAVGNGVSAVGNTIGNGLDRAGDTAKSWLGHIPLFGGFLGNVANKGLDLLGSGVSSVGNLIGNGVGAVGDVAQGTMGAVASGANALGGLAHQGLDAVGSGARWLGGALGSGIQTAGGWAQSAITGASSATGNFLGNAASGTLGAIGNGFGSAFNWLGDGAGALLRGGVRTLQGVGVDASHIASLSDFQSTNPSERWRGLLTQDRSDASQVQTLDALPSGQNNAASAPVHSLYAN
jgi:hypothetical protein